MAAVNNGGAARKQKKKKSRSVVKGILGVFGAIFKFLATITMVGVITGCIVVCIVAVNLLGFLREDSAVNIRSLQLSYTTIMYAYDKESGDPYELHRLFGNVNRVWVDYEDMPDHLLKALVAGEDERFYSHQGVDWKRTAAAFLNQFIPILSGTEGGSTLTQQLIKNVTEDDDVTPSRKMREIFRAINLEKVYSKDEILEAYLNVVNFGRNMNGVQTASEYYFGKDTKDLTIAECACIIAITKAPTRNDPLTNYENNKGRADWIIGKMLELGYITEKEHDEAVAEEIQFKRVESSQGSSSTQSWFVDHVYNEVIDDLVSELDMTRSKAVDLILHGGLRIYTTVDEEIQKSLEEYYLYVENFPPVRNADYPQSAMVIIDPNGKLLATVGAIGEKSGDLVLNRSTQAYRSIGSTIKPIGPYGLAVEHDIITWSTIIDDYPITLTDDDGNEYQWPLNHYNGYKRDMPVVEALQRSANTISVKITEMLTPDRVFYHLRDKLGMTSLVEKADANGRLDKVLSPMSLGSFTKGVTPLMVAGAYQIYANGGFYTKPYSYTEVYDANGKLLLKKNTSPRRIISEETATIINKLMQKVVDSSPGTGVGARLSNMPVAGKTGTTSNDYDQWFVGITPYYLGVVWLGYDENVRISYNSYPPPIIWKNVMGPIHENLPAAKFFASENVIEMKYCAETGELATQYCPTSAVGYYKRTYYPATCHIHISEDWEERLLAAEEAANNPNSDDPENASTTSSRSSGSSNDYVSYQVEPGVWVLIPREEYEMRNAQN